MKNDEFASAQAERASSDIWALLQACLRRYSEAASLVGFRSEEVERIREALLHGGVDLTPLLPAWRAVFERYLGGDLNQHDLFIDKQCRLSSQEWQRFLHWRLFPRLIEENFYVLQILRAVDLLPCESQRDAAEDVAHHLSQIDLIGPAGQTIF